VLPELMQTGPKKKNVIVYCNVILYTNVKCSLMKSVVTQRYCNRLGQVFVLKFLLVTLVFFRSSATYILRFSQQNTQHFSTDCVCMFRIFHRLNFDFCPQKRLPHRLLSGDSAVFLVEVGTDI
jgi:hypothetical protein